MKAALIERYGGPEVLHVKDVAEPHAKPNQVRVRLVAAAVNPIDWKLRSGQLRFVWKIQFPFVPGFDFAGIVDEVGEDTRFSTGQEVVGVAGMSGGAFAEWMIADPDLLVAKPASVSWEQAAALPGSACTALQALRDVAAVRPDMHVLLNGAGGGVGTFAVQIAKILGADVTAVAGPSKQDLLNSLGADHTIDYKRKDFCATRNQYDLVFDIVPNRSFWKCAAVLKPGGLYLTTMPGPGPFLTRWALLPARILGYRKRCRWAMVTPTAEDIQQLLEWMAQGRIRSVIGEAFQFPQVADAIQACESGHATGKIVLKFPRVPSLKSQPQESQTGLT